MAYVADETDEIHVRNVDGDLFPLSVFSTDPHQKFVEVSAESTAANPHATWVRYFQCGYKAIMLNQASSFEKPRGMRIMIDSTVPIAAGLSSSSAFTVCAAITTMHANGIVGLSPSKLAEQCISAERLSGTASGGMD